MDFGIVRERTAGERRVGLTPDGVRSLVTAGHEVVVEVGAGLDSGFADTEYIAAGADLAFRPEEVSQRCKVLVKVLGPLDDELHLIERDTILTGFLHLAHRSKGLAERLYSSGATAVAWELVEEGGARTVMEPTSAIGGRVAITLVQYHLSAPGGGDGRLLGGCPGVPPVNLMILGAGTAGVAAADEAFRLGAQVTLLDIDPRKLRKASEKLGRHVVTAIASPYNLMHYLEWADVCIGAVARPGEPAPRVLTRHHVRAMRQGALLLDMSIDEGGCADTSRPSTPESPIYEEEGVRHLCVPNLPSVVARTASRALTSSVQPLLDSLGRLGLEGWLREDRSLFRATQVYKGQLTSRRVARHHGGNPVALGELLRQAASAGE